MLYYVEPMKIQILFILLFAGNLLSTWAVNFLKKCEWCRFPGYLLMLIIPLTTVFFAQPHFELDYFWWIVAGYIAMVAGLVIIIWAKLELQKGGAQWHDIYPQAMVTSGPYHFIRHPIYLGLIFILVGWWWVWAAVYAFYFGMFIVALVWIQGYLEEKLILEKKFGDRYREYRQQAGMFWVK